MNGIIHNCSHPNDEDVHFRITEEKIFSDIFHYLEVIYFLEVSCHFYRFFLNLLHY